MLVWTLVGTMFGCFYCEIVALPRKHEELWYKASRPAWVASHRPYDGIHHVVFKFFI
jgi:hypothetical protein